MERKIVNLTPHFIRIETENGDIKIPPSYNNKPARVVIDEEETGEVIEFEGNTFPVVEQVFGDVHNLPDPEPGVIYVVSLVVAQAAVEREDVYYPAGLIRNSAGQVTGCKYLGHFYD